MRLNRPGESIVVVPSMTPDPTTPGSIVQAHEERFLFLLLLLRQPRLQMIYVTSLPIASTIVEYYLALLAGVIPSHARRTSSLRRRARRLGAAAERQAARAAADHRANSAAHPRPGVLPPRPLRDDDARARPRAHARHPDVRRRSALLPARNEERVPPPVPRGGRAAPDRLRGPRELRRDRRRRWRA